MILPLLLLDATSPRRTSAIIRKPSYLYSKTQPWSSNGASVRVASIGCRRLGRVDVRLIRGTILQNSLRKAWTSFKDWGTLQGCALFRHAPDNKGAGVHDPGGRRDRWLEN